MLTKVAPYAKAVIGTGVTFLGALGVALIDGHVTGYEWTGIGTSTLVAAGAIFATPNRPA